MANNNFKAQLGKPDNTGFLPQAARLAQIQPNTNPYVVTQQLDANSPVFYCRAQVMHEIQAHLRRQPKPGCVSLLGERRIGKSSLLNQLYQALSTETGLVTIYGNAQNWNQDSQEKFFYNLHDAICTVIPRGDAQTVEDYPQFRDFIAEKANGYRFVLIIDEFEEMVSNPLFDAAFFANLRVLGDLPEFHFGYLTASRSRLQSLCKAHKIDSSSYWNIFGEQKTLGLLKPQEADSLVKGPFTKIGSKAPKIKDLYDFTGYHPTLMQLVLSKFCDARQGGYQLDKLEIQTTLYGYYEDFWYSLSPEALAIVIKAVAGKSLSDLKPKNVVMDLQQRGLLTTEGKLFSHLFESFVPDWLPEGKTLGNILDEIDKGVGRGTAFFNMFLDAAEMAGKVRKTFLHGTQNE